MMSALDSIEVITAEQARPLRHIILRPHMDFETTRYPLDERADSGHAGAIVQGKLVGVATILHEDPEGNPARRAWRLRGMALLPESRKQGVGRKLLEHCLAHARQHDGEYVWCNAQIAAAGFYLRCGFQVEGDAYEIAPLGLHLLMRKRLR